MWIYGTETFQRRDKTSAKTLGQSMLNLSSYEASEIPEGM